MEKAREFQKNVYFCFIDYVKAFDCVREFSHSVVSDCLWPHGLQHTRPPCPSPTRRVYPNSCLLSWWCHPTISSSVVPFSSCLQSFSSSRSFLMSQLFASVDQTIRTSASVLPMNIQDWFPLGWTGLISLQSNYWTIALISHASKIMLKIL